ncbi:MAG: DUF2948 family protein [Pseudomonadota bacterium]
MKLVVTDEEDLKVMSAGLQDAVGKVGDFAYDAAARRFAAVVNRFRWEDGNKPNMRVRTGFHFDDVLGVKAARIRQDDPEGIVSLLSVDFTAGEDAAGAVTLNFSGGGAIRLDVECLNAHIEDISAPWRARRRPHHETDG